MATRVAIGAAKPVMQSTHLLALTVLVFGLMLSGCKKHQELLKVYVKGRFIVGKGCIQPGFLLLPVPAFFAYFGDRAHQYRKFRWSLTFVTLHFPS